MKKLLIVYSGEFGWEMFNVHSAVNRILERGLYDITLLNYESSRGLYLDKKVDFISHGLEDRASGTGHWDTFGLIDISKYKEEFDEIHCPSGPFNMEVWKEHGEDFKLRGEVRLDILRNPKKKIAVHCRKITFKDSRDWYDFQNPALEFLKNAGFELVFIGHPTHSLAYPEYGEDRRTIDLTETITHIKESLFTFGPASGTSILSLYCKVPVFSWSCGDVRMFVEQRDFDWNPFLMDHFHPWFRIENNPGMLEVNEKYTQDSRFTSSDEIIEGLKNCLEFFNREGNPHV